MKLFDKKYLKAIVAVVVAFSIGLIFFSFSQLITAMG